MHATRHATRHPLRRAAPRLAIELALALALAVATAACGAPAGPSDAGEPDAGDVTPPEVIATSPEQGATLVALDATIAIAFSEPIEPSSGSLAIESEAGPIAIAERRFGEDRASATLVPRASLPPGATITVTIGAFRDDAGLEMRAPHVLTFETEDPIAPTILATSPVDGATGVDPGLSAITVELSEPMRTASGRAAIVGPGVSDPGGPALGAIAWSDRVATIPVSGLRAGSSYRVELSDFEDAAGNPLDRSALGIDGALDFTTGPDVVAPRVVSSTPREGELDVDVGLLAQVAIELSEPMDETSGTFTLEIGGEATALEPRWDRGGTRVLLAVAGRLAAAAAHRIVLDGLRDRAGNALDATAYLGDGALDFTTGTDRFVPFVAFTSPEEGAADVPGGTLEIVVVFSEAMDPSTTTALLTGDDATVSLSGVWSSGDTVLTLAAPMLQAGRSYDLDLRGFRDAGGTMVDAAHPYLGDGIASFSLAPPGGERCGDALTEDEAIVLGDTRTWTIGAGAVTASDGSASCDPDGHGPDALVRVRKTTPAARDGGSLLHVVVTPETPDQVLDVDVLAGDCRTDEAHVAASRLRCLVERPAWEQWLDVGPGDYFVWVARDGAATFGGATILVEELAVAREGESCAAPIGIGSALHTPPVVLGDPHRWVLPEGYPDAMDRGVTASDPAGAVSCLPEPSSRGHDAVVTYEKQTDTSLVTVRIAAPLVSGRHGAIEIVRGCDPASPARAELACVPYSSSAIDRELTLEGPAGPISAWVVERRSAPLPSGSWGDSPEITLEIAELEPGPGDTCATAIPLTAGTTNLVGARRPWRAHAPACLEGGVTWFRYTPTQGLGILRADGPTSGAVIDAASGEVLRCAGDDTSSGVPIFGRPGREVCVALSSSPSVTQIQIEEIPYSGVRGVASAIDVVIPPGVSSLSPLAWMAVLGDDLYRSGLGRIQTAPTTGGPLSQQSFTGLTQRGGGAVARPEGLYVLSSSSSATSGPRVLRVTDATGALLPAPIPLETLPDGFTYPPRSFDAMTWDGTQLLAATGQLTISNTNPDCCTAVVFYAFPADGSTPVEIGRNEAIDDVSGIAADATFVYVAGRISTGRTVGGLSEYDEAIFRLRRDQLADPAQVPVAIARGFDIASDHGALHADDTTDAGALYVRAYGTRFAAHGSDVYVIVEPDADPPRWVGPLWRDVQQTPATGLAYDPAVPSLWLLDPGTSPDRWVRLE